MSEHAIRVIEIGKEYRIGERVQYNTLRENIAGFATRVISGIRNGRFGEYNSTDLSLGTNLPGKRNPHFIGSHRKPNYIWSLKDVSFDVKRGEILGIIGSNGAGKSTLLKLISGITEPTEGRIEIHGRIGSLLEVGTGFHQELTGRENIFLNGAILGMKKREIEKKFDEIVDFSSIEQFIDTPVKFYSSGMRVRLGFAVAAHLEPDILLLDEVLAVGDAAFQKKCLSKIKEISSNEERTIIFVTHDMVSIQFLCHRTILLENGKLVTHGPTEQVVQHYLQSLNSKAAMPIEERDDRSGDGRARIKTFNIHNADSGKPITPTSRLIITFDYTSEFEIHNLQVLINIIDYASNTIIFRLDSNMSNGLPSVLPTEGKITCITEPLFISPGRCAVNIELKKDGINLDYLERITFFDVEVEDFYNTGKIPTRKQAIGLLKYKYKFEK